MAEQIMHRGLIREPWPRDLKGQFFSSKKHNSRANDADRGMHLCYFESKDPSQVSKKNIEDANGFFEVIICF